MNNKISYLELHFLQKDIYNNQKDPKRFELTLLDNNCYTLSSFLAYEFLYLVLGNWIQQHIKSEVSAISPKTYNEFLSKREYKNQARNNKDLVNSQTLDEFSNFKIDESDLDNKYDDDIDLDVTINFGKEISFGKEMSFDREVTFAKTLSEVEFGLEKTAQSLPKFEKITFTNGSIYEGYATDEKANGFGSLSWKNGDRYIGEWKSGQMKGKGFMQQSNGDFYFGDFMGDRGEGKGEFRQKNGCTYIGEFKKGAKDGYGEMNFPSEKIYKGQWKNNQKHGYGVQVQKSGKETKGTWECGKLLFLN